VVLIEAPSNLGLMPLKPGTEPGVRGMPDALRAAGLLDRLTPRSVQRVPAPEYDPARDPETGIRNLHAITEYSRRLADAVGRAVDADDFALVSGGDCSILLGSMLALRRRGNYGLCFIDGHTDFFLPEQSSTGGAAGMDLALASGRGPEVLTNIDGLSPFVRDEHIAVLANRDIQDRSTYPGKAIFETAIHLRTLHEVREAGLENTVEAALRQFEQTDGFWIHVDVDVLDSDLMPAVDSPQPGGLTFDELSELIERLLSSDRAVGLQLTIFDPKKDPDGHYAKTLVDMLAGVFG